MNRKEVISSAIKILSQHPLAKTLSSDVLRKWIIDTYKTEPDRLLWHAKRTFKVGGSEIFKAVAFYRAVQASAQDEYYSAYTMSSIQDVVKSKIFASSPSKPNSHMRRGILSEPLARQVYIEKLKRAGHNVQHDTEASKALSSFKSEKHPWLAYNEDDILLIDGVRTLIDYKCPMPDPVSGFDLSVEEDYLHQLHLGCFILNSLNFKVEQLKLVKYNVLDADTLEINVPISNKIMGENLVAGDYVYFNYILNARLPEYQPQLEARITIDDLKLALEQKLESIPGATDVALNEIRQLASKATLAKSLASVATKQFTTLSGQIERWIEQVGLENNDDKIINIGALEIKNKSGLTIDEGALLDLAKRKGVDAREYLIEKYDTTLLLNEVMAISTEAEINKVTSPKNSMSIVVTRKTKGATAEIKGIYESVGERQVNACFTVLDESEDTLLKTEDLVASDIRSQESRRNYFKRNWQSAIETFIESEETANALLAESGDGDILRLASELEEEFNTPNKYKP